MPILSLRHIAKSFGAIHALTDVSLDLEPGEVLGLMGDNGAGKSTLVRIMAGNFPPTSGEMLLDGQPVHFHRPAEARAATPDTAAFHPARTAALRTVAHPGTESDQVPSLPDGEGWAAAVFHGWPAGSRRTRGNRCRGWVARPFRCPTRSR